MPPTDEDLEVIIISLIWEEYVNEVLSTVVDKENLIDYKNDV